MAKHRWDAICGRATVAVIATQSPTTATHRRVNINYSPSSPCGLMKFSLLRAVDENTSRIATSLRPLAEDSNRSNPFFVRIRDSSFLIMNKSFPLPSTRVFCVPTFIYQPLRSVRDITREDVIRFEVEESSEGIARRARVSILRSIEPAINEER